MIGQSKEDMSNPIMFVDQCNSYMKLKQCHKNWNRKIEIAELEGNKAKKILKQHGIPWYDEPIQEE